MANIIKCSEHQIATNEQKSTCDLEVSLDYLDPAFKDWLQRRLSEDNVEPNPTKSDNTFPRVEFIGSINGENVGFEAEVVCGESNAALSETSEQTSNILLENRRVADYNEAADMSEQAKLEHKSILKHYNAVENLLTNIKTPRLTWRQENSIEMPMEVTKMMLNISRAPVKCPHCNTRISPSTIMKHFIIEHVNKEDVYLIEIYLKHRCLGIFQPGNLQFGKNTAISMFAFGGVKDVEKSSPIERGLALSNAPMPEYLSNYQNFLPILFLMCRTCCAAALGDPNLEAKLRANNNEQNDIWVIWLACSQLLKPLHAIVTLYNRFTNQSISRIMRVRNIADSQNCYVFMNKDFNYLDLTYQNVRALTNDFKMPVTFEIIFIEYD